MLDNKALVVLGYLRIHFEKTNKPIYASEINIKELTFNEIFEAIETLSNKNRIEVEDGYIHPRILSVDMD